MYTLSVITVWINTYKYTHVYVTHVHVLVSEKTHTEGSLCFIQCMHLQIAESA